MVFFLLFLIRPLLIKGSPDGEHFTALQKMGVAGLLLPPLQCLKGLFWTQNYCICQWSLAMKKKQVDKTVCSLPERGGLSF